MVTTRMINTHTPICCYLIHTSSHLPEIFWAHSAFIVCYRSKAERMGEGIKVGDMKETDEAIVIVVLTQSYYDQSTIKQHTFDS